ncbi:hypothetical protein [Saccharothrix xinjiangensis]|uniref:Uncharacterized protein n=1 Tax=Saccharothrix xinjiangensis TaxID=204798 RepID=A0ABV9Y0X4_9PSEU
MILSGIVQGNGEIASGTGFTVKNIKNDKNDKNDILDIGVWIGFDQSFETVPSVTATLCAWTEQEATEVMYIRYATPSKDSAWIHFLAQSSNWKICFIAAG